MEKFNFDLQRFDTNTAFIRTADGNSIVFSNLSKDVGKFVIAGNSSGAAITNQTINVMAGEATSPNFSFHIYEMPQLKADSYSLLVETRNETGYYVGNIVSISTIKLVKITSVNKNNDGKVEWTDLTEDDMAKLNGIKIGTYVGAQYSKLSFSDKGAIEIAGSSDCVLGNLAKIEFSDGTVKIEPLEHDVNVVSSGQTRALKYTVLPSPADSRGKGVTIEGVKFVAGSGVTDNVINATEGKVEVTTAPTGGTLTATVGGKTLVHSDVTYTGNSIVAISSDSVAALSAASGVTATATASTEKTITLNSANCNFNLNGRNFTSVTSGTKATLGKVESGTTGDVELEFVAANAKATYDSVTFTAGTSGDKFKVTNDSAVELTAASGSSTVSAVSSAGKTITLNGTGGKFSLNGKEISAVTDGTKATLNSSNAVELTFAAQDNTATHDSVTFTAGAANDKLNITDSAVELTAASNSTVSAVASAEKSITLKGTGGNFKLNGRTFSAVTEAQRQRLIQATLLNLHLQRRMQRQLTAMLFSRQERQATKLKSQATAQLL